MSIHQLRQLVRLYAADEIDYNAFRSRFVSEFLSADNADALADRLSNSIESVCADFSAAHIENEPALKARLAHLALAANQVQTSSTGSLYVDFVLDDRRYVAERLFAAETDDVNLIAMPGSSNTSAGDAGVFEDPAA